MDKIVTDFLNGNRVGVLAIIQDDGTVHSASLHYAHSEEPLRFYFATGKGSYKCRPLIGGSESHASLVVGFSETEFKTVQATGKVKIVSGPEAWKTYTTKFPDRKDLEGDQDMCLLEFTPQWWRYRDMKIKPMQEITI